MPLFFETSTEKLRGTPTASRNDSTVVSFARSIKRPILFKCLFDRTNDEIGVFVFCQPKTSKNESNDLSLFFLGTKCKVHSRHNRQVDQSGNARGERDGHSRSALDIHADKPENPYNKCAENVFTPASDVSRSGDPGVRENVPRKKRRFDFFHPTPGVISGDTRVRIDLKTFC